LLSLTTANEPKYTFGFSELNQSKSKFKFLLAYNAKLWGASTWAKIRAKRASPRVSVPATEGSANSVLLGVQRKVRSFAATTSR